MTATALPADGETVQRAGDADANEGAGDGPHADASEPEQVATDADGSHGGGRAISSMRFTTEEPAGNEATQVMGEADAGSVGGAARDAGGAAGERGSGASGDGSEQSPADQPEHNKYKSSGHSQTCGNSVHVNNNDIAANAASAAPRRRLSFIAFRNVRAGLVWVDELFTAREWRGMGVARWLMWRAAEGRRVELQVLSGPEGEDARRAYTGMGLHKMTGKETCRTYREVSDRERYEFWLTNEYVVRSRGGMRGRRLG